MNILITGSNGFIASHIINDLLLNTTHKVFASSAHADKLPFSHRFSNYKFQPLDITDSVETESLLQELNPNIIIHAAAIGSPDICEQNKILCRTVNITGTRNLVDAAIRMNIRFIYLSTDFIFNGKNGPYKETDTPDPVNYYGWSKMVAENYIIKKLEDFSIVRLCSVYGPSFSGNARGIVTLTRQKLSQNQLLKVVNDQFRTPTFVKDISKAILKIINLDQKGIIHISGNEMTTPYLMAIATAAFCNLNKDLIQQVSSKELNEPALRPRTTGFIIEEAATKLNFKPTSLQDGLLQMMS